tara:strand:- start:1527 stop:1850 length:324 start_codon:yes stop_codon:yes gene_type:complete
MSDQKSTMSPKRLFIILCIAGILMWFFSNSKVEVEVVVEPGIETTEKKIEEQSSPKVIKVKKVNRKKFKKKDVIITEESSEYIPQTQRKNFKKEIKNDYTPQSQRGD